jgi:Ca2+-binding RTX toxin-like protein
MKIRGTRKDDILVSLSGDDVMTGKVGADQFYYTFDGSNDTISDFNWANGGDRIYVDSGAGVYSGAMSFGTIADGTVLTNHRGAASFSFAVGDWDGDGQADDMRVSCDIAEGSLILIGITQFDGSTFLGG